MDGIALGLDEKRDKFVYRTISTVVALLFLLWFWAGIVLGLDEKRDKKSHKCFRWHHFGPD